MINKIAVYSRSFYQEISLPTVSEQSTSFRIEKELHRLQDNLTIHMEELDHCWCFSQSGQYQIFKGKELFFQRKADPGDILRLYSPSNEEILLVVGEQSREIPVARKYILNKKKNSITLGRDEGQDIVLRGNPLISKHHASLEYTRDGWLLRDEGQNGVYVNGRKIEGWRILEYGDSLELFGCHMTYLGEILAILNPEEEVSVREGSLAPADEEAVKWMSMITTMAQEGEAESEFAPSPRFVAEYDTEEFEIEAPPAPKVQKERSLLMTMGPSVTMVIPMLIGVVFTGFGVIAIGLITMVGSAVIGAFWAYMNWKNQKKSDAADERERFQKYSDYLRMKEEDLKKQYEFNRNERIRMYPETAVCAAYNEKSSGLWNRNPQQKDYLFVRLGTGNAPLPKQIRIPEERFTLIYDTLAGEPARIKSLYEEMKDVPLGMDLSAHRMIGVIGGQSREGIYPLLRTVAVQIAANLNYQDVKLVLFCDGKRAEDRRLLEDLKWLPHMWNDNRTFRFAADSKETIGEVADSLLPLLRERREAVEKAGAEKPVYKVHYVFLITSLALLEGSQISNYLFRQEDSIGVTALVGASRVEELPNACEYMLQNDSAFTGDYSVTEARGNWRPIRFDYVSSAQVSGLAHRLAAIRIRTVETQKGIPDRYTFLEMYNAANTDDLRIAERWKSSKSYESLRAPIGMGAGNRKCFLDIHEHAHGPHGLVAGTSGAGKSELLQSWILSLAVNYSPEDVAFFLVDFKGGGMANQFQELPHLAGAITNLSENEIYRALVSIRSENTRRQRIFAETGRTDVDIYKYTRMYKNREVTEPLPHLLIIVDEFAELKKKNPEFIKELISVARIGRSLGVHLILATQTPAGTVDDNIDKNSRFRICLRVADEQGSRDMLKRPDAAYITHTGRAYLRVGYDEVFEQFQSAWSGAAYQPDQAGAGQEIARLYTVDGQTEIIGSYQKQQMREQERQKELETLIALAESALKEIHISAKTYLADPEERERVNRWLYTCFEEKGFFIEPSRYNDSRLLDLFTVYEVCASSGREHSPEEMQSMARSMGRVFPESSTRTQLMAVVEAVCEAAKKEEIRTENHLWIPELPENLYLRDVVETRRYSGGTWKQEEGEWTLEACVGRYDNPGRQFQAQTNVDFANLGNYGVFGGIGSGKSVFLQTLVYSLITGYTPEEVNLYCIDYSSRMLECYKEAPHVGGVLFEENREETEKFFYLMRQMLAERRKVLGGGNFRQYRMSGGRELPAVVIVIDQYGVFREKTEGRYDDQILEIAKEGTGIGIYLAVSAGGVGNSEVPLKLKDNIRNAVCLQLNDRYAYKELMRVEKLEICPRAGVRGRGLWNLYGEALEFQTALCLAERNDYERSRYLKELSHEMAQNWEGERAVPIPVIPEHPVYSEFAELPQVRQLLADDRHLPLGYDIKSAAPWSLDLSKFYCYLVSGKKRTGKKNFLQMAIRMAAKKGGKLYVFGKGQGILAKAAQDVGAAYFAEEEDLTSFCVDFKPELIRRNQKKVALEYEGYSDEEIYLKMKEEEKIFLFIEDLPAFAEQLYHPAEGRPPLNGFFETFTDKGWYHQIYIFAGINQDEKGTAAGRGVFENIVRDRNGIHFGGNPAAQQLLNFDYIRSFRDQSQAEPAGVGLLASGDGRMETGKVVIPLAGK